MKFLEDAFKKTGTIYHAYVVTGERERAAVAIEKFLNETLSFDLSNNPDFFREQFDILGIDDARRIKLVHAARPFGENTRRIFFIMTNGFTLESQNAFLKIFEEPQENNHFFVIIPSAHTLLPTLRSRVVIVPFVDGENETKSESSVFAEKFINASIKDRMKMAADLAGDISDDKKTKADAILFLNALELLLRSKKSPEQWTKDDARLFRVIAETKDYLHDRASSVKMLLENLALSFSAK